MVQSVARQLCFTGFTEGFKKKPHLEKRLERKPFMSAPKGGARRSLVPPVSSQDLQNIFDTAIEKLGASAFDLGPYNSLKSTQACSAAGLEKNAHYLKEFGKISKGEIQTGQLKEALLRYGKSHNKSEWKDDLWAGKLASQFVCLMAHCRRLGREPEKLRQCFKQATGTERQAIEELLSLKAWKKASGSSTTSKSSPLKKSLAKKDEENACKKARTLKEQVSDISLDSQGFPAMLKSPAKEKEELPAREAAEATASSSKEVKTILERTRESKRKLLDAAAEDAAQAMVACGSPRPAKRPASHLTTGSGAKKPAIQTTEKSISSPAGPERRPWSDVKFVGGAKQSYLQGFEENKWKPIVACSEKQGQFYEGGHKAVIEELQKVAMDSLMTKEKMVEKRDELIKA